MATDMQHAAPSLRFTYVAATGALVFFAFALLAEAARSFGYTDVNTRVIRVSFILLTVLAAGAAVVEHFLAATRELQRMNAELERRLAERAREIESDRAQAEDAKRERALARERSRILADMHDGLGAILIRLLRHVQSETPDRAGIERCVLEAMREMRLAVDALQPCGGDLAAVLGNLRYRLDDTIRAGGAQLAWEMEELPDVRELEPAAIFTLQRIVLEAITNALKHSGAQRLRFSARQRGSEIEIAVEDDGRGFDPARPAIGLGLLNMRVRAQSIGARFDIQSQPGMGTVMRLFVPLDLPGTELTSTSPAPDSTAQVAGQGRKAA